MMKNLSYGGH